MKNKFLLTACLSASLVVFAFPSSAVSASSAGQKCSRAGALSGTNKAPLVCARVGGKLVWKSTKKGTTTVAAKETVSQSNARKAAKSYLGVMAFSRSKLIEQLEYENYSTADATYGVDAQNADWNAQAAKSAKAYLKLMPFSRISLIDQLIFEGFSQSQAEYGVSTTGL
jgi:hypothetical protein